MIVDAGLSGTINKLNSDLTFTESCYGPTAITSPTKVAGTTIATNAAP